MGLATLTKKINHGVQLLHEGDAEQAASHFRRMLDRYPGNADALHLLSVAVFQLGRPALAVEYAEQAIGRVSDQPDYHSNLGRYYLSLGRNGDAELHLRQALALAPRHVMAHCNLAATLAAQGRRAEALDVARSYVEAAPQDAGGHHLVGSLLSETGRAAESIPFFERALALRSTPETHNNFGNALQSLGRSPEAIGQYEKALRLREDYPEAASNLGAALQSLGHNEDARAWFLQALRMRPGFAMARANLASLEAASAGNEAAVVLYRELLRDAPSPETWNNLGNALQELGRYDEALEAYGKALELNRGYYLVHNNIGNLLRRRGRPAEALPAFERALDYNPRFAEALNNRGVALAEIGRVAEAQASYEKAIEAKPDYPDPWINLGNIRRDAGQPDGAVACYRKGAEISPNNAFAWNNLGCALGDRNDIAEAIQCFERAVALMPSNHHAYSNILLNLHYLDTATPERIWAAHVDFGGRYENVGAPMRKPFANVRDPERPLRVGYVSADFRRHSVAYFLEPVVERHARGTQVEVFCYSDVARPDEVTARFQRLAGVGWRDMRGAPMDAFASRVHADQIDILVDTGGHTANSRLADFTARPAPVQVTWLGYPDTTGLASIGYRITDKIADPVGSSERWNTETLVRLDGGFLCFRPPADAPPPAPSPSSTGEPFTFGSFNNLSKISNTTFDLWARILQAMPNARLALKNRSLNETSARERLLRSFAQRGIGEERIWLSGLIESLAGHLDAYGLVDVALDTVPYHGTTTTCEALWMGVPVVTLAGVTHASRVGASLLAGVGLDELIASEPGEYVAKALMLAQDASRLAILRGELRPRMIRSPITDEFAFTDKLESAYRSMWRAWCAEGNQ